MERDPEVFGNRREDKASYVRAMFTAIAGSYDLINSVLSLGRDRTWRRFAASRSDVRSGGLALDLATGTAELAKQVARRNHGGTVVGMDFCPRMLEKARAKLDTSSDGEKITLVMGDALNLPFRDNVFDCVTIGFGLRNVADINTSVREMARVVKPGGKIVSLELTRPSSSLLRVIHSICLSLIVPRVGKLISGSREAYTYLPESIRGFPSQEEVQGIMQLAGIQDVENYRLTFGIATVYTGIKVN